jgi:hypothetical protein
MGGEPTMPVLLECDEDWEDLCHGEGCVVVWARSAATRLSARISQEVPIHGLDQVASRTIRD